MHSIRDDDGYRVTATCRSTPYDEHRDYVLAVLGRRCAWIDPADREALLHDAYLVFLEKQRDGRLDVTQMCPPQVRAYLTRTALHKAMDERRRLDRRHVVSLDDAGLGIDPVDPGQSLDDLIISRFDDARVREIVAELPRRQRLVITLRYFFCRSPEEIQHRLGITERVYRRELERASHELARRFALVRQGTFCQTRRSAILAHITGVAGTDRGAQAQRHLETCPSCASWAAPQRSAMRDAA
jgi:RNA polymerase sigma factor (sigma-70 family)